MLSADMAIQRRRRGSGMPVAAVNDFCVSLLQLRKDRKHRLGNTLQMQVTMVLKLRLSRLSYGTMLVEDILDYINC